MQDVPDGAGDMLRTLSLAVAQSPVALVITDARGQVTYVSPRFTAMTGCHPEELPDFDAFAQTFAEPGSDPAREMWRVLSGGGTWHGELPARRRTAGEPGGFFWASVTIAPVRDEGGGITHIVGSIEDITERRQAEEHIRRAQKMQAVGVLAGGIAHDFNNILTAILGYSHLALDSLPEGTEARDDILQVTIAAERAKSLVQQLLTFSRKEKVGREVVDVRGVVREALALVQPTVPHDVTLRFLCDDGEMPVLAAPTQIHQVVVNLCKNAVDAVSGDTPTEDAPHTDGASGARMIAVSLVHATVATPKALPRALLNPGHYICLTVADTGCGMDGALLERVFEPFFTTKAVDKGTGLGLAAVHGIVADHGGVIDVVSAPGEGAAFSVYLPRHDADGSRRAAGRWGRSGRGRVLLAGEERTMLGMAGRLLRMQGFRVVASANSRRALALFTIAPERFDLIVLEQGNAAQTWRLLALARAFSAACPGVPILVCADPGGELEGAAMEAAGVTRILRTPVAPDEFVTLAGRLIKERRAQAEHCGA
ncbi:ATP-binding protein [Roseomonas genomospecies 6]|nr:ATP-binding protein [Roseomonas genomospecies 6]